MASESTNTTTNTSTSAPTNPDVQATASKLAQKLSGLADQSPAAYGQSLYAGVSPTTRNAWAMGTNAANGLINSGGLTAGQQGAISGLQGLTGAYDQNSPGYQTMRQNALDDAVKGVTSGYLGSGLLGSRSFIQDATKAGVNALAPIDYQNYTNSVNNKKDIYSQLFGYGQQGLSNQNTALSTLGAIGGAQDADLAAQRQGEYDLYTRQQQAPLQWLQGITSASAGNAANTGVTTTNSQTTPGTPWWQTGLSLGLGAASLFL